MPKYFYILYPIIVILGNTHCFAQVGQVKPFFNTFSTSIKTDSGTHLIKSYKTVCKGIITYSEFIPAPIYPSIVEKIKVISPINKVQFLTIHGNVTYDFFYRSKIDTPFSQQNLQQHTERVWLDVLIKEKYPVKFGFTSRQSNSPYFKNFTDVNLQFDKIGYHKNLKQQLLNKLTAQIPSNPELSAVEAALKEQMNKYSTLKNWLQDPGTLQKIIEERERIYNRKLAENSASILGGADSSLIKYIGQGDRLNAKADSLKNKFDSSRMLFSSLYDKQKAKLDSLSQNLSVLQKKADSTKSMAQQKLMTARQKIYRVNSEKDLRKIAADNGVSLGEISKFEKQLSAVKSFSLGRSMLNYTELTAQNIMISGINVEYNPSYYAAFAAGKINYRFRDFYNRNAEKNSQYLVMGRFGLGNLNKSAVIFTLFQGRKSQSEFAISDSVSNHINIMGYSVETIFKKDEHTFLSAEFAKSTKPITGNLTGNKQNGSLLKFSDESNMGINIKAQTRILKTETKLGGFYRKTGENFQSFSLFSYNSNQTAWLVRADQSIWRNKITLTGMLRQNDFSNVFTEKTYKATTVFKTALLNVRIPKYPSLSVGYYPGTQLYFIDKDRIRENAYYIINGSMLYSYNYRGLGMTSSFIYNRYINQATDSGFVLYQGINYYASQTIFLKKLQLQGGYSNNRQPELVYQTLEASFEYSLRAWLKAGAGSKYNKISKGKRYWGQSIQVSAHFKHFGGLQIQYEKSYLPAINRTLYPVEIGRVMWFKNF